MMNPKNLLFLVLPLVVGVGLAGCDAQPQKLSPEQAKNFKGGPMPPGTWDKIAETQREWAKKHPPTGGAPGSSPMTPSGQK